MNNTLHRFCFAVWMLGFAGMWVTKGVRLLGELPFAISARLSLIGGLSLCFLIALDMASRTRRASYADEEGTARKTLHGFPPKGMADAGRPGMIKRRYQEGRRLPEQLEEC